MSDKQLILSIRNGNVNNEDYNFGIDASNVFLEKKDDGVENYETLQDKIDLLNKSMRLDDRSGSAVGVRSIAYGYSTIASGAESFASGCKTRAAGARTFSTGFGTQAIGENSFACGDSALAAGECSYAEGKSSRAIGNYSHAEGYQTNARGDYSHAEGCQTLAEGIYSHVEGWQANAIGNCSHAEGYQTTSQGDYSHAEGYQTFAIKNNSHTEGYRTLAEGVASHAEGYQTTSQGDYSHAEGCETFAIGNCSHTEGCETFAIGDHSHAEGYQTTALAMYSHAEGYQTSAMGNYSHAEGENNIIGGIASHIEGGLNRGSGGKYCHIEGYNNNIRYGNDAIHIEGLGHETLQSLDEVPITFSFLNPTINLNPRVTQWNTDRIFAIQETIDDRLYSYQISSKKLSNSDYYYEDIIPSTQENPVFYRGTVEKGEDVYNNSILTRENIDDGFVYWLKTIKNIEDYQIDNYLVSLTEIGQLEKEGYGLLEPAAHVQGKYSKLNSAYAHIVGGGSSADDRKNIHTLDWDGNATFTGDIEFRGYIISEGTGQAHFNNISLSEKILELENRLRVLENK